jgi:hypothetical protein
MANATQERVEVQLLFGLVNLAQISQQSEHALQSSYKLYMAHSYKTTAALANSDIIISTYIITQVYR